ncbi:MAG: PAS domain S-box protein [Cytophagaceae bacterium]
MSKQKDYFLFSTTKKFAQFLIFNKLEELGKYSLQLTKNLELPLFKHYAHLSTSQLEAISTERQKEFLTDIINDQSYTKAIQRIENWNANRISEFSKSDLQSTDILIVYSMSKQVMHKFLPEYTNDVNVAIEIVEELEKYFLKVEKHAFDTFWGIQKEKLVESEDRFKTLSEAAFEGVILHQEGKILTCNSALSAMFGYKDVELLNMQIRDLFIPSHRFVIDEHISKKSELPYEVQGLSKEGNVFYTEVLGKNTFYNGNPVRVVAIRDVSDKRQADEALRNHKEELESTNEELRKQVLEREEVEEIMREREMAYRLLADNSSDIIARLSPEGTFLYASPASEMVLGYKPEQLLDTNVFSYIHKDDLKSVEKSFQLGLTTSYIQKVEHRFRNSKGQYVWLESTGHAIRDGLDDVTELQVAARPIGDRKEVEQKLMKERKFLKAILDNLYDSIVACDQDGNLMFFNKAARKLHGKGIEQATDVENWAETYQLYKSNKKELLHKDEIPLVKAYKGQSFQNMEMSILSGSNKYCHFLSNGQPIYDGEDEKLGALVVMHEVTAIKEAERQLINKNKDLEYAFEELQKIQEELRKSYGMLEQKVDERTRELKQINQELHKEIHEREKIENALRVKNKELIKTNKDLDNFVYTASHDLKAPVSNIEGLVNALANEVSLCQDESLQEIIGMINISLGKFNDTLHHLTEISKIQRDLQEDVDEIDIEELVEDVMEGMHEALVEAGGTFSTDYQEKKIRFSKKDLRSILFNLLSNAIKYRSAERKLEINLTVYRDGEYTIIAIKDNGLGIAPSNHAKVFAMFKRFHDHVEGSGIGLYIVKRIVDNNNGYIEIESDLNKGATFRVCLKS